MFAYARFRLSHQESDPGQSFADLPIMWAYQDSSLSVRQIQEALLWVPSQDGGGSGCILVLKFVRSTL